MERTGPGVLREMVESYEGSIVDTERLERE
jgi:hypothetical protein